MRKEVVASRTGCKMVFFPEENTYKGGGSLNTMLMPFVATGAERESHEFQQYWTWNSSNQRYTHEGEQTNTLMLYPRPDAFP